MAEADMKAKLVRVRLEEGKAGLFYATSPDLHGLLVAEPTLDALEDAIPVAIAQLFEVVGEIVLVSKLEDNCDDFHPWVAFPADIARKALVSAP